MADWDQPSPSQGNPGDANCPHCSGAGVLPVPDTFPERLRICTCMHLKMIVRNVESGWPGLVKAPGIKGVRSVLWKNLWDNLWVTSPLTWFKSHLRWCAFRMPPPWDFKVVTDVDLMRAWLGSVALSGRDIIDPDAAAVSMRHLTLLDLVEPPTLLVIRLGIKTAANKEMPNVLLETLLHRTHLNKPVWIYNDLNSPFDESMRSFSYEAAEFVSTFERIERKPQRSSRARSQSTVPLRTPPRPVEKLGGPDPEEIDETLEDETEIEPTYSDPKPPRPGRARLSQQEGIGKARVVKQPRRREKEPKKPTGFRNPRGKKS